ncbi:hypothetical protein LCGC14_2215660 [marine sediment metagenome]|uniref:ParB/Sulfiredoxin domain-containing protein n=1 Tax=marine sediment metagenome TaxID=412755 RepID=A0A0F9G859_9ZZZZ
MKKTSGTDSSNRVARLARASSTPSLILLPDDLVIGKEITIPAAKLNTLGIDERYQRIEIHAWVNDLISVIQNGGVIPAPIWVAERPDGTRWIVDGQQRYWAHWHCGAPIRARLFEVAEIETEKALFHIANRNKHVGANIRVKGWPGPAGDLILWMNTHHESALRNRIAFDTGGRFPAGTIARCMASLLVGPSNMSRMDDILARLDTAVTKNLAWAEKAAKMFAVLLCKTFPNERIPSLPSRALALICYDRWKNLRISDAWPMPGPSQVKRMCQIKWTEYAPDSKSRWLPLLKTAIAQRWPQGTG